MRELHGVTAMRSHTDSNAKIEHSRGGWMLFCRLLVWSMRHNQAGN